MVNREKFPIEMDNNDVLRICILYLLLFWGEGGKVFTIGLLCHCDVITSHFNMELKKSFHRIID